MYWNRGGPGIMFRFSVMPICLSVPWIAWEIATHDAHGAATFRVVVNPLGTDDCASSAFAFVRSKE